MYVYLSYNMHFSYRVDELTNEPWLLERRVRKIIVQLTFSCFVLHSNVNFLSLRTVVVL